MRALPLRHPHSWEVTPAEAIALQRRLAAEVVGEDAFPEIHRVAGVDCGFEQDGAVTRAAVAVLDFPSLQMIDRAVARVPTTFPYIPGLLSFREIPAVLAALHLLTRLPDLLLVDGQGYAHPRRCGIACHLGVITDLAAIGVAKTRLCGVHGPVPPQRGSYVPLSDGADQIGVVMRSRSNVAPIFVSIGHRVSLTTAVDLVGRCITRYRLPETTRWAHRLASG